MDGQLPQVPLDRLRSLLPAEHDLYFRLFLLAGGGPDTAVPAQSAAEILKRSGLPQEALRRVWNLADDAKEGALSLEGFCVACRLCGHAQSAPSLEAAMDAVSEAVVSEIPPAPPRFEGVDDATPPVGASIHTNGRAATASFAPSMFPTGSAMDEFAGSPAMSSPMGGCASSVPPSASGVGFGSFAQPSRSSFDPSFSVGFDFAASAFGADPAFAAAASQSSLPPPLTSGDEFGSVAVPGLASRLSRKRSDVAGRSRGAGSDFRRLDAEPVPAWRGPSTSTQLSEALISNRDMQSATETLGRELVAGRRDLEDCLRQKARLETLVERGRARLESLRKERGQVAGELLQRRNDVEHLFASLDFARHQVEELEREIADFRESRKAFGPEELRRAAMDVGDAGQRNPADKEKVRTAARLAQRREAEDYQAAKELEESTRRAARRKQDLQARQQLLLEDQRQAEQDRSHLQKSLDSERQRISSMQTDRLLLAEERLGMLKEANRLAREAGLEPGALQELLRAVPGLRREAPDLLESSEREQAKPASDGFSRSLCGQRGASFDGNDAGWQSALSRPGGGMQVSSQPSRWAQFGGRVPTSHDAAVEKDLEDWHRRFSSAPPAG